MTLPYGVQDYLPDECYNKKRTEDRICAVFGAYGYDRIETPALEYGSNYAGVVPTKRMFKLTDNDGELLVLRPDITLQVCRMAAGLDICGVKKLYYAENSFEYLSGVHSSRTREFSQAGVELLGNSGPDGEVEIVTLAVESLLSAGLEDFLIEIGDVRFFKCLMDECGLCGDDVETVKDLIDNKDQLGLEVFLQQRRVDAEFKEKFLMLPSLFGGAGVLAEAGRLCGNTHCGEVLRQLEYVNDKLVERGYGKYISFDLALLSGLNYYSGLVVKGLTQSMGLSILDGGRYDEIGSSFREGMKAVGFTIGIKRLLIALDNQNALKQLAPCDYAYANLGADEKTVFGRIAGLRKKGLRVTDSFADSADALETFARDNGIRNTIAFYPDGTKEAEVKLCDK